MAPNYGSLPGVEDVENPSSPSSSPCENQKKLKAEYLGTFILVWIGTGGLCVGKYMGALDLGGMVGLWMLGSTLAIALTASKSGAHLNPAVTLAFAIARPEDFSMNMVIPYWIAQLLGGITAGLLNMLLFFKAIQNYEGNLGHTLDSASTFGDYYSQSTGVANTLHAFLLEMAGTGFLTCVIFLITNKKNGVKEVYAAPLIGITIGLIIALLGTLTGGGINPARDFGPRIVTYFFGWGRPAMENWWVYVLAPLIGGPLGAMEAEWLWS